MTKLLVPATVLDETAAALSDPEFERTVLWQVPLDSPGQLVVARVVVPAQKPIRTALGHAVHVDSGELARIQFEAHHLGLRTQVQLHTHPTADVRMSALDVAWAISDFVGAISVIVPSFGANGLAGWPGVAIYERGQTAWRRWSQSELADSAGIEA